MRTTPMARMIIATAALALLISSAVSAQGELRLPEPQGKDLKTAVITNALDETSVNEVIVETTRKIHQEMDGQVTGKDHGWLAPGALPNTASVTQTVLDLVRGKSPNVMVVSGGNGQDNVGIARAFTDTTIIDIGQAVPCVTDEGRPDTEGVCAGQETSVPFNYTAVDFAVEDGAYLAGVLAAKDSRGGTLGVISGDTGCAECNRYVNGFLNGARHVDPEIPIEVAYLADDEVSGFADPVSAKTFAEAFIDVYQPRVLMPVGRASTTGMLEAACDAGITAIGTGTDVRIANPDLDCILASVTRDVAGAVRDRLIAYSWDEGESVATYDLTNEGVIVTDEWRRLSLPVDTKDWYGEAETALVTGATLACPDGCTKPFGVATDEDAAGS